LIFGQSIKFEILEFAYSPLLRSYSPNLYTHTQQ
jgi:hypothetical protein